MSTDREKFAAWLRDKARAAGFDPDVRGGIAALAKAAGVDQAPVSRALSGAMTPKVDTQRALAKAFGIQPMEMYVRSGTISAEDVAEAGLDVPTSTTSPTVDAVADRWNVPAERRDLLLGIFDAVAQQVAKPQGKPTDQ